MKVLKTKTLVGTYVHVLSTDPALDREAEGFIDAYRVALEKSDFSQLPLKPGEEPLIWEFTHLGPDETTYLLDRSEAGANSMVLDAVALALVKVRGLTNEKGEPVKLVRRPQARRGGNLAVIPDQLAALFTAESGGYLSGWVNELGNRVCRELLPRNG